MSTRCFRSGAAALAGGGASDLTQTALAGTGAGAGGGVDYRHLTASLALSEVHGAELMPQGASTTATLRVLDPELVPGAGRGGGCLALASAICALLRLSLGWPRAA